MRLPVPIDPISLESLASWLERIRLHYFYPEDWLNQIFTSPLRQQPNVLRTMSHYQQVADLTELEVKTLFGMTLHRFVPCYYLAAAWPVWPLEQDDIPAPLWEAGGLERYVHGRQHGKICPLCWGEQQKPAILLPWSLRLITSCPKHRVLLVDRCSACSQALVIDQSSGRCATCGQALARLETTPLDPQKGDLELTSLLWSAHGYTQRTVPLTALPLAAEHPLWSIPTAALMQFLWSFGQLVVSHLPHAPLFEWTSEAGPMTGKTAPIILKQAEVQTVHTVLRAMWHLLKGWPETWYTLLEALVLQEQPLEVTPSTCLPARLKRLFPGEAFSWVHAGWEAFMWREQGRFLQLASWLLYYHGTPREGRLRHTPSTQQRIVNLA